MIPGWLDNVLAENSEGALGDPHDREQLAAAIVGAIPKELVIAAIKSATHAVLVQRGIADGDFALSSELANNAAATVILMLAVGRDNLFRKPKVPQPMQPIIIDTDRCVRFQGNAIVRWLLDEASAGRKVDLNDIALQPFSDADRRQFAQLINYSVSGYCSLSYVANGHKHMAEVEHAAAPVELEWARKHGGAS